MQSTINLALHNACLHLNLPSTFAAAIVKQLWQDKSQPASPVTPPAMSNLEKLNRQQVQKLESLAGNDMDERTLHKNFLAYVNRIPNDIFKSVSLVEHMETFLNPPTSNAAAGAAVAVAVPEEDDDEDLAEVVFHLRNYDVGVKTHRVYELRGGVHVFVGMLGMNEFRGMIMPDLE